MSASAILPDLPSGGFSFDNVRRNEMLASKGFPIPRATKTGTTIAGIVFKDGVILGADTRATNDTIVADKNCMKIHYLAPNMYCCGAGTAADCDYVTRLISSQLELHALNTGKQIPVCAATRMLKQYLFRYQGHVSAALIVGGVDKFGSKLVSISPHGHSDSLPYTTMGSGSLAAMAVFEANWRPEMDRESGKKLVRDAIAAGVFNDLGSGSNIDLCIITKEGVEYIRPYDQANVKGVKQGKYVFPKGSTAVLSSQVIPLVVDDVMVRHIEEPLGAEAMDES